MSKFGDYVNRHIRLVAWLVLAVGMVIILVFSARDVGLTPAQWAALIVATIGLAGLCVWIIGWEDRDDAAEGGQPAENKAEKPAEKPGQDT